MGDRGTCEVEGNDRETRGQYRLAAVLAVLTIRRVSSRVASVNPLIEIPTHACQLVYCQQQQRCAPIVEKGQLRPFVVLGPKRVIRPTLNDKAQHETETFRPNEIRGPRLQSNRASSPTYPLCLPVQQILQLPAISRRREASRRQEMWLYCLIFALGFWACKVLSQNRQDEQNEERVSEPVSGVPSNSLKTDPCVQDEEDRPSEKSTKARDVDNGDVEEVKPSEQSETNQTSADPNPWKAGEVSNPTVITSCSHPCSNTLVPRTPLMGRVLGRPRL